jgi:hypothetical protein
MDIYVKISLAIRLTYGICILIVNLIKRKKKEEKILLIGFVSK